MGFETQDVERKVLTILRIVAESPVPVGARIIAGRLPEYGVVLGERAVRYHLKLMDEKGLTRLVGRDGRMLAEGGREELRMAMVQDKVGLANSKITQLAFRTDFNLHGNSGNIPVNISLYTEADFPCALKVMRPVFAAGLCVSDLVAVAAAGDTLGDFTVPDGKTGMATVCSVVVNGVMLKAGVPVESRFGGILQMRNRQPLRFVELIHYNGSSLDPVEVFIRARMTTVREVAGGRDGTVMANLREIPSICRDVAESIVNDLRSAGINGLLMLGGSGEAVCEIPVDPNKTGLVMLGGMNPVAAAEEAGIRAENHAQSTVMEYRKLKKFEEVIRGYPER
jgi:HTH-type transcriptional regulator, global nitrogen regulator NrpRI